MNHRDEPDRPADRPAAPSPVASMGSPAWAVFALLATATLAVYWPALRGEMLWDDPAHIPRPEMRSLDGLQRIWVDPGSTQQYYPLLFSWFWAQHKVFGDAMPGYHVVNVLLHVGAALLVYLILRKLRVNVYGALLAAAIFALHPVHVESVAWVTEQKNTLSAVFYLGAMLAYLRFDAEREAWFHFLALMLFAAAVLSKTVAVTLPPALLVVLWWRHGKISWQRDVIPLLPFFWVALVDGVFTAKFERTHIGAEGPEFELSPLEKPLLAGRALWFYLEKLFWPADLILVYPRWTFDPSQPWQWLFPIGAVALLLGCWAIHRRWRAPLAGYLFFVGTLFPVLGFFNVFFFRYSYVSDHFQYLASLGVIVVVAGAIGWGIARLSVWGRIAATLACCMLVALLGAISSRQAGTYTDMVTLFQTAIDRNPDSWMTYNNLGLHLFGQGKLEESLGPLQKSLEMHPEPPAYNNYGALLLALGRTQEAIDQFETSVRLSPAYPDAHSNLGHALVVAGRPQEAIEHLELSLRMKPNSPQAHCNLGEAFASLDRQQEAIGQFRRALELKPDYPEAHDNLGLALFISGLRSEGLDHLKDAVRLKPDLARSQFHLGMALLETSEPHEAIDHLNAAVRYEPDNFKAWANLGAAYAKVNRSSEAVAATQRAIALARAQGKQDAVAAMESWLRSYRSEPAAPAANSSLPALPPTP